MCNHIGEVISPSTPHFILPTIPQYGFYSTNGRNQIYEAPIEPILSTSMVMDPHDATPQREAWRPSIPPALGSWAVSMSAMAAYTLQWAIPHHLKMQEYNTNENQTGDMHFYMPLAQPDTLCPLKQVWTLLQNNDRWQKPWNYFNFWIV